MQRLAEDVRTTKARIEVQLQRRADLVPKVVGVVEGALAQEGAVLAAVGDARTHLSQAIATEDLGRMASAHAVLDHELDRPLVLIEADPALRSAGSFITLLDQIEGSENRVAAARNNYNKAVSDYNKAIKTFPTMLTASVFDMARPYAYFDAGNAVDQTPTPDVAPTARE